MLRWKGILQGEDNDMFCTHCGKEINDDALFCIFCGQATGKDPKPAAAQEIPKEEVHSDKHRRHRGSAEAGVITEAPSGWGEDPNGAGVRPAAVPPVEQPYRPDHGGFEPVGTPVYQERPYPNDPYRGREGSRNDVPYGSHQGTTGAHHRNTARHADRKRGSSALWVILGAGGVVLILALVFLVMHLVAAGGDMDRIRTVENCTLGEYETGMKDVMYGYFRDRGYDTVTWEGAYTGFMKRGVQMALSSKGNSGLADVKLRFEVRDPYCRVRAVDAGNGWNNVDKDMALYLNSICYTQESGTMDAAQEKTYLEKLDKVSSATVLYGTPQGMTADPEAAAQAFGEKLSGPSVLKILELEERLKALQQGADVLPEPVLPEPGGNDGPEPVEPQETGEPSDEPENPHLSSEQWTVQDTDRKISMTFAEETDPNAPGGISYPMTIIQGNEDGSRTRFSFTGKWEESQDAFVYEDGTQTWHVKINGEYQDIVIAEGASGRMTLQEDGSLIWKPENPGTGSGQGYTIDQNETVFVPGDRDWTDSTAQTSVSRKSPQHIDTKIRVISARASSTIQQEKVSNDPILMFDGVDETSWQEGVDGYGVGESVAFTFDGTYGLTALSFKLGNWRNQNYYETNAAPKKLTIILGDERFQVEFEHKKEVQWVTFSQPVYVDSVTILIDDVFAGTKYDDTCINEITAYGRKVR